jgi:hypothetical protein
MYLQMMSWIISFKEMCKYMNKSQAPRRIIFLKKIQNFKIQKQSHCLLHCIYYQTKNRLWINNQTNQYWTIMQMVKNMPKSSIDVENFKCLPTMNRIQVIFMLRKFNFKDSIP